MMKGKEIVLQKAIPGKNRLVDIEDDDEIYNDTDVTVLLVDVNSTFEASIVATSSANMNCAQIEEMEEAVEVMGVNIIDMPVVIEQEADAVLVSDKTDVQANVESNSKTSNRCHQINEGSGTVPNPAPLPQLTAELENILKTIGILKGQKTFIYFWATHLSVITNNQPTKRDYLHYASSIVAAYPELKGGKGGCGIVKTQLSTCIRNRKANIKRRYNNTSPKAVRSVSAEIIRQASVVADKQPIQTDIETALKELEKNKGDTPHVRYLLKETFTERRKWIKNDAKKISEVVEKYPHLKLDTLILSEFCSIKKWKEEEGAIEKFITKVDGMIEVLGQHFDIEQNELGKAEIMLRLYESVTNKRFRKNTPLFLVKEALSSTQDLMTMDGDSPRLVMFTMEGAIAAAYVVADEIRMKILEPSVSKSVACLLASYYVWDTNYPNAYKNTMEYVDHEVLGTVIKENAAIDKFIRDRNRTRSYE